MLNKGSDGWMTKIECGKVERLNKERMTCVIHHVQMNPPTFKPT
jgi:hypothetical protein